MSSKLTIDEIDLDTGGLDSAGNIVLDDGAGDSPQIQLVGGSHDDTGYIFLEDDAQAGKSDLVIKLPGNSDDSVLSIRASDDTELVNIKRGASDYVSVDGPLLATVISASAGLTAMLVSAGGPVGYFQLTTNLTNTVEPVWNLVHLGGAIQAGFGARLLYRLEDGGGNEDDAAFIDGRWDDPSDGSEDSRIAFGVRVGGAALAEICRVDGNGILMVQGKVVDLAGGADALALDDDGDTTISAPTGNQIDFEVGGADVARLFPGGWTGDTFAFTCKNTSGAAASPGDLGYITGGEYKTTATAYLDVEWCVVLEGGADNADIRVARRGRVAVTLNGNCSAGDYLYTSTTAGQAQPQGYVRPELFAMALTANGAGAGGTCSALLLCERTPKSLYSTSNLLQISNSSSSSWAAQINAIAHPTATLTYKNLVGNADSIVPAAADHIAKLVLHNTTRGDYGLISSVNTGASSITLTANAPAAWAANDNIQVNSLTCLTGGAPFAFDFQIADTSVIPAHAVGIEFIANRVDSAAAGYYWYLHPFMAYSAGKLSVLTNQVAGIAIRSQRSVGLYQRRFCVVCQASGAGTATHWGMIMRVVVPTP